MDKYALLIKKIKKINLLKNVSELLEWDTDTLMPISEQKARAEQQELLAKLAHQELLSKDVTRLIKEVNPFSLSGDERCNYYETKKVWERNKNVPEELVSKIRIAVSLANASWKKAKQEKNFKLFEKDLEKIIKLKKEYASKINPKKCAYHVLFEDYEDDLSYDEAKKLIKDTYQELKELIEKAPRNEKRVFKEKISEETQKRFVEKLLKDIGFDFDKGLLAKSVHPFCAVPSFGRITTRFTEGWLPALLSTMHEGGHALYEQGLPLKHYATPLGQSKDMSVHESQSRIWENHVGRSKDFWSYQFKFLKKEYALNMSLDEFMKVLNTCKRDFIRVNADELTYVAHILVRMEIEEALIIGNLKVKDAPAKWNELYEKYLGIKPRNDAEGILQDVHWSFGGFGYFPTYSIGSIIAAQLFYFADKDLGLKKSFKKGRYDSLLMWLRNNVHKHGRKYTVQELVKKVTGEGITNKYYVAHLKERYRG